MTKEEKALLLKDLTARLPYGVQVFVERDKYAQATLLGVDIKQFSIIFGGNNWSSTSNIEGHHIEQYKQLIKPYLRPMSSMTDEEITEMNLIIYSARVTGEYFRITEYYNKNYLDYYDLIGHKLAIEAPEGMYDIK